MVSSSMVLASSVVMIFMIACYLLDRNSSQCLIPNFRSIDSGIQSNQSSRNTYVSAYSSYRYTTSFDDILVIVKYNYPSNIDLICRHMQILSPIFRNIVLAGPWDENMIREISSHTITAFSSKEDDNVVLDGHYKPGSVAYASVLNIMANPLYDFRGYLFMHDDLAVNVEKLMSLNKSVTWIAPTPHSAPWTASISEIEWKYRNTSWWWFNVPVGIEAMEKALQDPYIDSTIRACLGSNHTWYIGKGDFFYIPREYKESFQRVASVFSRSKLFLEIAIPTYAKCFARSVVELKFCDILINHELTLNLTMVQQLCQRHDVFHPIKISKVGYPDLFNSLLYTK